MVQSNDVSFVVAIELLVLTVNGSFQGRMLGMYSGLVTTGLHPPTDGTFDRFVEVNS